MVIIFVFMDFGLVMVSVMVIFFDVIVILIFLVLVGEIFYEI